MKVFTMFDEYIMSVHLCMIHFMVTHEKHSKKIESVFIDTPKLRIEDFDISILHRDKFMLIDYTKAFNVINSDKELYEDFRKFILDYKSRKYTNTTILSNLNGLKSFLGNELTIVYKTKLEYMMLGILFESSLGTPNLIDFNNFSLALYNKSILPCEIYIANPSLMRMLHPYHHDDRIYWNFPNPRLYKYIFEFKGDFEISRVTNPNLCFSVT